MSGPENFNLARNTSTSSQSDYTSASIEDHVVAHGYLIKRGHIMPSWNCRYFELTFKKLLYYVDETKKVLKGEFNLAPDMLVRDCNFRPFCFCLFPTIGFLPVIAHILDIFLSLGRKYTNISIKFYQLFLK